MQGYTEPSCQTINVGTSSTAIVTGTFTQRGYLRIQTSPSVPGTISIAGVPVNHWGDWTDRPVGTYHVCFGDVPTATTPPCQDVAITAGNTTTVTGTYT